jgi:hypothetical protein
MVEENVDLEHVGNPWFMRGSEEEEIVKAAHSWLSGVTIKQEVFALVKI